MEDVNTTPVAVPYASGRNRDDRLSKIEQISKQVFSDSGTNGSYMETIRNMDEAMDSLKYVGLDVQNMSKLEKLTWDAGTFIGFTSPFKRMDKKRQRLETVANQLEGIVKKSEKQLYHPSRGLYSELTNAETQRDQAIDLRELTKAEIQDLQLERKELRETYSGREFGQDKKYESRMEIRNRNTELKKASRDMTRIKKRTNRTIMAADQKSKALTQGIGVIEANMGRIEDKAYEIRMILDSHIVGPQATEYISEAAKILQNGVTGLVETYLNDVREFKEANLGIFDTFPGMIDVQLPHGGDDASLDYDVEKIIQESRKFEEERDSEVESLITRRQEEPFALL